MSAKSSKKKKHWGLGLLFWLVFACAVIIVFFAKKDDMLSVLKQTEFFSHVSGSEPAFITEHELSKTATQSENSTESEQTSTEKAQISVSSTGKNVLELTVNGKDANTVATIPDTTNNITSKAKDEATKTSDGNPVTNDIQATNDSKNLTNTLTPEADVAKAEVTQQTNEITTTQAVPVSTMSLHLWFIIIDGDGTIVRKESSRTMPKSGTPLADSINNLLAGPTADETDKGFTSLIPIGTQLLGASVKNKVATLNFSENFSFNTYGVEGYLGQLMQIVYTATAFSTIDSVQFLIEGEKREFLGEGVRIGVPLSRSSFR